MAATQRVAATKSSVRTAVGLLRDLGTLTCNEVGQRDMHHAAQERYHAALQLLADGTVPPWDTRRRNQPQD